MQEVLEKKSIKNIDFNCDLAQAYGAQLMFPAVFTPVTL